MKDLFIGQEPVFPSDWTTDNRGSGMSKRFYAACAAMQGLLGNKDIDRFGHHNGDQFDLIKVSYRFADELLRQENENS